MNLSQINSVSWISHPLKYANVLLDSSCKVAGRRRRRRRFHAFRRNLCVTLSTISIFESRSPFCLVSSSSTVHCIILGFLFLMLKRWKRWRNCNFDIQTLNRYWESKNWRESWLWKFFRKWSWKSSSYLEISTKLCGCIHMFV